METSYLAMSIKEKLTIEYILKDSTVLSYFCVDFQVHKDKSYP